MSNNTRTQSGAFVLEFALLASIISLCMIFVTNMTMRLILEGHLERLSYSGVSLIKERTTLYNADNKIKASEAVTLFAILKNSLSNTMSSFEEDKFGMILQQVNFQKKEAEEACEQPGPETNPAESECYETQWEPFYQGALTCTLGSNLSTKKELFAMTSRGRPMTLYEVTLCYKENNWVGNWADSLATVSASSVMMAR